MALQYCDELIKQYQSAKGISFFGNSREENVEFIEWLKQQQKIKEYYQHYLLMSGFYYDEATSVEVGKGKYDTITSVDTRALLVTEYASSFQRSNNQERIIDGKVQTAKAYQFVLIENRKKRNHTHIFLDKTNLFYTQNPYSMKVLPTFSEIHNSGKNIVVGAYGRLDDKDRTIKIKQLRELKEQLIGHHYKEVYSYVKDNYIYFIHTDATNSSKKRKKFIH